MIEYHWLAEHDEAFHCMVYTRANGTSAVTAIGHWRMSIQNEWSQKIDNALLAQA